MKKIAKLLLAVGAVITAVHLFAKSAADKIRNRPERFDINELRREPIGDTHFISCEDGTILRAITAGEGPQTVVFAHGYGSSLLEWNLIWNELLQKGGYRLIAFDLRGHEKSSTIGYTGVGSAQMAGDYKTVLEYFDVRDAILVGHSTGGFLSIVFMVSYPQVARDRLRGAVLMASLAGQATKDNPQNQIQIPMIQSGIMDLVARSDVYGLLFGASVYGENPTFAPVEVFRETFVRQNHQALIPILENLSNEDYYVRLHEITVPCVVVCGEKDATTPRWHSEAMGEQIPNARSIWVPNCGHMLNWEAPEVIVEAIESLK